jgi:hypothetical protein
MKNKFPVYGIWGLLIILLSEMGLLLNITFFGFFMTPLCWTGLILFLDALNFKLVNNSLIVTRSKEFLWMFPWSVVLWYFFEFYNLFIKNWHYVGLPENIVIRYFGYIWAFSTIWPGVLEIFELLTNLNIIKEVKIKSVKLSGTLLTGSFTFGLFCMILPFLVSAEIASYLAAPVWLGLIFVLDPLNFSWKRLSLWKDLNRGSLTRLLRLLIAGAIAGIFWEFWNYWAVSKWIYTVPILGDIKIFEMPIVGYLGFPPFAVEIFVMWETIKYIFKIS